MKIYTKTGDAGETGLFGGARVSKASLRVEAYGEVDELNSSVGWARVAVSEPELDALLNQIQNDLFEVGADYPAAGRSLGARDRRVRERPTQLDLVRLTRR